MSKVGIGPLGLGLICGKQLATMRAYADVLPRREAAEKQGIASQ